MSATMERLFYFDDQERWVGLNGLQKAAPKVFKFCKPISSFWTLAQYFNVDPDPQVWNWIEAHGPPHRPLTPEFWSKLRKEFGTISGLIEARFQDAPGSTATPWGEGPEGCSVGGCFGCKLIQSTRCSTQKCRCPTQRSLSQDTTAGAAGATTRSKARPPGTKEVKRRCCGCFGCKKSRGSEYFKILRRCRSSTSEVRCS